MAIFNSKLLVYQAGYPKSNQDLLFPGPINWPGPSAMKPDSRCRHQRPLSTQGPVVQEVAAWWGVSTIHHQIVTSAATNPYDSTGTQWTKDQWFFHMFFMSKDSLLRCKCYSQKPLFISEVSGRATPLKKMKAMVHHHHSSSSDESHVFTERTYLNHDLIGD